MPSCEGIVSFPERTIIGGREDLVMKPDWTVLLSALLLVVVGIGAGDGARSPVARVLEVKGKATIVDPENFDRPAALFGTVYADDRLVVDKKSSVVLVFRGDGHVERVAASGTLKVTQDGCQPRAGVERLPMPEQSRALVGKISKGSRGIVQGGVVMARAAPPTGGHLPPEGDLPVRPAPGQIGPVPESTLLTAKPTFSWPAVPNAKKNVLNLYFLGNKVWSASSEATRLEYIGETPLKSGAMYSWEVTTILDGKTATICEGVFRTASDQQQTDAEALKKLIAEPEIPYLAVAALWYKQNGLVTEAIAVHQQLAKLSNDPAVYWALSELCGQAGRNEEARGAEQKAAELEKKAEGGGRKAE